MPGSVTIIPRKIYLEDLAIGSGTDLVPVLGVGNVPLTQINSLAIGGNASHSEGLLDGTPDGVTADFTLPRDDFDLLMIFKNGIKLRNGVGYTVVDATVTFAAEYIPEEGAVLEYYMVYTS